MTSASEIEKRFRNKPELFTLKKHEAAKSDAWKYFSLLLKKQGADSDSLTEVQPVVCRFVSKCILRTTNSKLKDVCIYVACYHPSKTCM